MTKMIETNSMATIYPKGKTLKEYFPVIRTREEVLDIIQQNEKVSSLYGSWTAGQQKEFVEFCTGMRGIKILYDSFFKSVMNPDITPERIEAFLSALLGEKVEIIGVIPGESPRITDKASLLILDILVRLSDGSLANLECQKIGYHFPGERCACYSADLLLRQYARIKSESGKHFRYSDIKTVYTIVFFERSTGVFKKFPGDYIHRFQQTSDTGLELNLLQKFILIPLDIFTSIRQNKGIGTLSELEAWLTFFSTDRPEEIVELVEQFPQFRAMYEDVYSLCEDIEKVASMYSKELLELDRNTVRYMIEELEQELEKTRAENEEEREKAKKAEEALAQKDMEISEKDAEIARLKALLERPE